MPKSLENQLGFSGGEWSPLMDARVDHPKYRYACRQLQNMVVLKQGGVTRRPGMRYKGTAKYASNFTVANNGARLLKFQFSPTTSFVLEFGHRYVRFYSNRQQVTISAPAAWNGSNQYNLGDLARDAGVNYYCQATVKSATAPASDAAHWYPLTGSIYEIPSPYSGQTTLPTDRVWTADIFTVVPCQLNDVVYLVHPDYPVYRLTRYGDTRWTLEPVVFLTPPLLDQNVSNTTIAASSTTGTGITLTASAPAWTTARYYETGNSVLEGGVIYECLVPHVAGTFETDLAAGKWTVSTIFQAGHVGSYWQLSNLRSSNFVNYDITGDGTSSTLEAKGAWELHTYGVWTADIALQRSFDNGLTWDTIRTISGRSDRNADLTGRATVKALYQMVVSNYSAPIDPGATTPRVVFENVDAFIGGVVQITAVSGAYEATADVVTQLDSTTATRYWSEGAFSAVRGYPRAVTSFQQRIVYGGTQFEPQRIWGSVTNDIENFDRGDQTQATDSFAFDLAAIGRGPIEWLMGQSDLFAGFSGAEWIINSGSTSQNGASGAAITPTAINATEQSAHGSTPGIAPVVAGNAMLYTQRAQRTIQQMLYSVYTNKYMSADLTSLSDHLFGGGIARIDYQPQFRNQSVVWVATKSGGLCGMTYQLEQEVFGWARNTTGDGTDFGVESVCVIEGQGAADDEVWVVVNRTVGNVQYRYIELIDPTVWETQGAPISAVPQPMTANAFYVDSGITVHSPISNVITGLGHLIGRSVVGAINGNTTFGPLTVADNGSITVPNYEPDSGNLDTVAVGLPINYAVQVMRLDSDPRAGVIQGLTKTISRLYLRLVNALGGVVSNGSKSVPVTYRTNSTPLGEGPSIFTGEKSSQIFADTISTDPTFIIQGSDALPLTLLAMTVKYDVTGTP